MHFRRSVNSFCIFLYLTLPAGIQAFAQDRTTVIDIISDTGFQQGIGLIGASSAHPDIIDTLYPFGKSSKPSIWKMPQWATRFDLKGIRPVKRGDTVIYQNEGKRLSFLKKGKQTLVGLEVFGSREYQKPRVSGESWPHLLLEQRTNQHRLAKMGRLDFSMSARLMYAFNRTGGAYDPGLHAAQVTLYLLVQNINQASPGRGDYFWFGLPLYDSRHRVTEIYAAQDLGKEDATKKFILNVASEELFSGSLHDQKWITIGKDIYPLLKKAYLTAKNNGYLKTTVFEDLAIESTNVGWEIPGTFDCGIQLKNLSLKAGL